MSETFLRKSTKHLSSFTSRFRKVTQWSFWDCVSSYVPINIHDTLHTLVTWYLRVSWLAQNTAYFQLSNCHWHGKHNLHLSPLIIYFNPLWLNPLSFQVNKAEIPENCNISSEEWIFNLTVLFFLSIVYLHSGSMYTLKLKDQHKLSNIPVIFMSTSQLVCMSKYTRLVATLHRWRNPHASSPPLSLYLPSIN